MSGASQNRDRFTNLEEKTRTTLAEVLEQCGELADAVRFFTGDELLEVLDQLDSLRALLGDSSTTLRAAVSR